MNSSISFLGDSQTFVGVLSTLIILCVSRNTNNFMLAVLTHIKIQIEENARKLKPSIALDFVKKSIQYKALLFFTKNDKYRDDDRELYEKCESAIGEIEIAKFAFQGKITNWDVNVCNFANIIDSKEEQQKGPMFAFAFSIVVFIFDELLRCQYFPWNVEFVVILSLFTLFVAIYWTVKWMVFMLKDNNEVNGTSHEEYKYINKFFLWLNSLKYRNQILIHLLVTFLFLYLFSSYYIYIDASVRVVSFSIVCNIPFVLLGLSHLYIQEKYSEEKVTMHYVYHFFYMFLLSVGIWLFVELFIPDFIKEGPFLNEKYLFWLKFFVIGFILCVGLLCPFICPFLKYNMIYLRACTKFIWINLKLLNKAISLQFKFWILARKISVN